MALPGPEYEQRGWYKYSDFVQDVQRKTKMRSRKWSLFQTKRHLQGAVNVVWKNGDSNRFYVANTESIEQYLEGGGCYIFVLHDGCGTGLPGSRRTCSHWYWVLL